MAASALTISTCRVMGMTLLPYRLQPLQAASLLNGLRLFDRFVNRADHVEGLFRQVVVFAVDDRLEVGDGVFQRNVLAGCTGKHFGHEEGLRQEALDLARTRYRQFVFG